MAAATVASGPTHNYTGNKHVVMATLTTPADGDTWDTGLYTIDTVDITFKDASAVAADCAAVASVSGGVITFQIAGTARTLYVKATGN